MNIAAAARPSVALPSRRQLISHPAASLLAGSSGGEGEAAVPRPSAASLPSRRVPSG